MSAKKRSNRTLREVRPPWKDTALDRWSTDVDPFIMSGDKYVDEHDPGFGRYENQALAKGKKDGIQPPFMHPTHDVTYGND